MRLLPPIPRQIAAAVLLAAAAAGFSGCSSSGSARVVTSEESRRLHESWREFARRAVEQAGVRLLYEARLSRSGVGLSGSLAVEDHPGREFSAVLSDDFGLRVLAATWDGAELRFDAASSDPESVAAEWRRRFSGAISPRSLSLLFVGVPDDAEPDAIAGVGDGFSLFWTAAAIRCDLDSANLRPRRAFFGKLDDRVEVALAFDGGDVPASLVIEARKGGRVQLRLLSVERGMS